MKNATNTETMTKAQIETVLTPSDDPRFTLRVNGIAVRVTRYGTDEVGRTHFELAGAPHPDREYRDVFPTDRGYVEDGEVWMLDAETVAADADHWEWVHIGSVEGSSLRPADSIEANRTA
jgi:hypothetical protein